MYLIIALLRLTFLIFIGYVVGIRFGWDAGIAAAMWIWLMMPQQKI